MQYYSLNAEYLWATIVVSSLLGIGVYLLVGRVENWVLRHERRPEAAGCMTTEGQSQARRSSRSPASRRSSMGGARRATRVEALVGIDLSISAW
jgi:hypothetical protein